MKVKYGWYYVFTNKIYYRLHSFVLNPFWRGKVAYQNVRRQAKFGRMRRLCRTFVAALDDVPESKCINNDGGEKIFTMWQQGEKNAPPLVRACFRSIRKNCRQELVVLDDSNIFDYITLPDIIVEKYRAGKIGRAHFADICRVELLYKYGGFWLDATCFVTMPIPADIVAQDFFVYGGGDDIMFIQNCFIRARRGAYLLAAWRQFILNFWENYDVYYGYFMHQLMFRALVDIDARARSHYEQMPHIEHGITHRLWAAVADAPFSQELFDEYTAGTFFQKTSYRSDCANNPVAGSVADVMINKMYK